MSGGSNELIDRVKEWTDLETWTDEDINAEFDGLIDNIVPEKIEDYSHNSAQQLTQSDPGTAASPNLATKLSDEIEQLRFVVARAIGETNWLDTPDASISELAASIGGGFPLNRISSGRSSSNSSQPLFLVPNGSAAEVDIKGASTDFVYYISGTSYTINSDVTVSGLSTAPSSNNTATVNAPEFSDQEHSKYAGEYGGKIPIDSIGSEISSLSGQLAAFSINNGAATEYFIARIQSDHLSHVSRGFFFDSNDSPSDRIVFTDNDTITLLRLTWVFAKTDGTAAVSYTNPRVGGTQPTSPSTGDYWFDTVNNLWKTFNSVSWIDADAMLIGVCAQDTSNCVVAYSFDFFQTFTDSNTVQLMLESNTEIRGNYGAECNVYGTQVRFNADAPRWDITANLESGQSEAASTIFFLYVTEDGDTILSTTSPRDRTADRKGWYHPYETWRFVGLAFNDASSNLDDPINVTDGPDVLQCVPTVSGNALTVTVIFNPAAKYPVTNDNGKPKPRSAGPILQATVASGSDLGHVNFQQAPIYFYLCHQSDGHNLIPGLGTAYLNPLKTATPSALTGADNDDERPYVAGSAFSSLSACYFLAVARMNSNLDAAGTWDVAPSVESLFPVKPTIHRKYSRAGAPDKSWSDTTTDNTRDEFETMNFWVSGHWTVGVQVGPGDDDITNWSVTDGSGNGDARGFMTVEYDGTTVMQHSLRLNITDTGGQVQVPLNSIRHITPEDLPGEGNHSLTVGHWLATSTDSSSIDGSLRIWEEYA